jgi:hypothetical protein
LLDKYFHKATLENQVTFCPTLISKFCGRYVSHGAVAFPPPTFTLIPVNCVDVFVMGDAIAVLKVVTFRNEVVSSNNA